MKILTTLYFISLTAQAFSLSLHKEEEECIKELKIDKKVIEDLIPYEPFPEDNVDIRGFVQCGWKKFRMLNVKNEIDWERVEYLFKKSLGGDDSQESESGEDRSSNTVQIGDVVTRIIDRCQKRDIAGDTFGHILVKRHNCILEKIKALRSIWFD